jgi:hypothetical protein
VGAGLYPSGCGRWLLDLDPNDVFDAIHGPGQDDLVVWAEPTMANWIGDQLRRRYTDVIGGLFADQGAEPPVERVPSQCWCDRRRRQLLPYLGQRSRPPSLAVWMLSVSPPQPVPPNFTR